jgi:hypothetical protein
VTPGAYGQAYETTRANDLEKVRQAVAAFGRAQGRAPRILVAKAGQDGHTRGFISSRLVLFALLCFAL